MDYFVQRYTGLLEIFPTKTLVAFAIHALRACAVSNQTNDFIPVPREALLLIFGHIHQRNTEMQHRLKRVRNGAPHGRVTWASIEEFENDRHWEVAIAFRKSIQQLR